MSESSCTALLSGLGTMDLDVCFYSLGFSLSQRKALMKHTEVHW